MFYDEQNGDERRKLRKVYPFYLSFQNTPYDIHVRVHLCCTYTVYRFFAVVYEIRGI